MTRFFVGQRVRIVDGEGGAAPSPEDAVAFGRQGIITDMGRRYYGVRDSVGEWWDVFPSCLEPILDPGRELVSWESMKGLWTPEQVTA